LQRPGSQHLQQKQKKQKKKKKCKKTSVTTRLMILLSESLRPAFMRLLSMMDDSACSTLARRYPFANKTPALKIKKKKKKNQKSNISNLSSKSFAGNPIITIDDRMVKVMPNSRWAMRASFSYNS
jgi:hypothetical protein